MKRIMNGSGVSTDKGWTSENAWDSWSPVARKMITRSFNLTEIVDDTGQIDGLQLVRYLQKQFYNSHHDYFDPESDKDFYFHLYSGGSNQFATGERILVYMLLLYITYTYRALNQHPPTTAIHSLKSPSPTHPTVFM